MGVSIYYTCERNKPLTNEEHRKVTAIIDTYNQNFEWADIGETFYVYEREANDAVEVFQGSTKLPFSDDYEIVLQALSHWLQCLTDIRRAIADGAWHVHLDDTDAAWDDEAGWHMR